MTSIGEHEDVSGVGLVRSGAAAWCPLELASLPGPTAKAAAGGLSSWHVSGHQPDADPAHQLLESIL